MLLEKKKRYLMNFKSSRLATNSKSDFLGEPVILLSARLQFLKGIGYSAEMSNILESFNTIDLKS